jgi:hypothetical protein
MFLIPKNNPRLNFKPYQVIIIIYLTPRENKHIAFKVQNFDMIRHLITTKEIIPGGSKGFHKG